MSDKISRCAFHRRSRFRQAVVACARDEDGSSRMDRIALGLGGIIVAAAVVTSFWRGDAPGQRESATSPSDATVADTGVSEAGAERRIISAGGIVAPEPSPAADVGPSYASPSIARQFEERPDDEAMRLQRLTDEAIAAEAAARAAEPAPAEEAEAAAPVTDDPAAGAVTEDDGA
jgi:hypothetical protein